MTIPGWCGIGYLHEHDAIVSRIGTSVRREAVDKGGNSGTEVSPLVGMYDYKT